jgi:hypothetical protein
LPVFAANPLSSADVKAAFGNGAAIKGTSIPGGDSFELTLAPSGDATMKVAKGDKAVRTGTWRVSATGYCANWGGDERCYTVVANGKAYDVVSGSGRVIARWTKS